MAVLELACRFEMANLKVLAMEKMVPSLANAPAMQIYLGRKHHVREWVVSGLNKLVQRAEPLNKDDIELIGLEDGLKIMGLRETCVYDPYKCRWQRRERGHCASLDFTSVISQKFNL